MGEAARRDPMLAVSLNARLKRHGRDREWLWNAIERNLDQFAEEIWETPLSYIANFFKAARGRDGVTTPLWDAIEEEPERFAEIALETTLDKVAGFFKEAQEQDRAPEHLWEAIESQPERLSATAQRSRTDELAAFCRRAPTTVIETALADIPTDHWDEIPASESLVGGTWVASACGKVGREDLKLRLVKKLIRRADPTDFPKEQGTSLGNVAWLLKNVPSTEDESVTAFLDAFCTREWLRPQFTKASCGSLAAGLRILGLHQPIHIRQRFLHLSLDTRLKRELLYFRSKPLKTQGEIIQLLGCAALCGRDIPDRWLRRVSLRQVSKLPVDVLSHRSDASDVENYQYQLWLGLRAVAFVTGESIQVPTDIIDRTLDLWKNNLEITTQKPECATHHVNQSMVTWLVKCLQENQGLLPSPAPDWPPRKSRMKSPASLAV